MLKLHDYQAMTEGAETIEVDPHARNLRRMQAIADRTTIVAGRSPSEGDS